MLLHTARWKKGWWLQLQSSVVSSQHKRMVRRHLLRGRGGRLGDNHHSPMFITRLINYSSLLTNPQLHRLSAHGNGVVSWPFSAFGSLAAGQNLDGARDQLWHRRGARWGVVFCAKPVRKAATTSSVSLVYHIYVNIYIYKYKYK